MTNEHALDLVRRWQESRDEAAITELVEGHRRAMKFAVNLYRRVPLPAWIGSDDLEAVAAAALVEMAGKFDSAWGTSFVTAAVYCMRSRIRGRVLAFVQAKKRQCATVSLDAPIDEGGATLGDFVGDTTAKPAGATLESQDLQERLDWALGVLPEREERIMRLRFGVGVAEPVTLDTVGEELGCTRQRVRQLEAQALRRLRHPSRARHLRPLLDSG